jgi:hypothetical protein
MDSNRPNFQQLALLIKNKASDQKINDLEKKYNNESRKDNEYDFNDSDSSDSCNTIELGS